MSNFFIPGSLLNRFRGYEVGIERAGHARDARPKRSITVEECILTVLAGLLMESRSVKKITRKVKPVIQKYTKAVWRVHEFVCIV